MTPEGRVKSAVTKYLRSLGWLVIRVNAGRIKLGAPGAERMVCLAEPGTADLICLTPDGRFVAVETKRYKGKPTEKQLEWGRDVEKRRGEWYCTDSVEDLMKQLEESATRE